MGAATSHANEYSAGALVDAVPGGWPSDEETTDRSAPRQESGWIAETFVDGLHAEIALCNDRSDFIRQQRVMKYIPSRIIKHIMNPNPNSQIEGFDQLFNLLDTQAEGVLHRLVAKFFYDTLPLRSHLKHPDEVACRDINSQGGLIRRPTPAFAQHFDRLELRFGVNTKFEIARLGTLIVENVEVSGGRELPGNREGGSPEEAMTLHHQCLGPGPLRVTLEAGIERPSTTASVQIVDRHSGPDVVVAKRGDDLVLERHQYGYIACTTNVRTLKLARNKEGADLEDTLNKIARFHYYLLLRGPANTSDSVTLELFRLVKGNDGRFRESAPHILSDVVKIGFCPGAKARYGVAIKNNSEHMLYAHLFYFGPSDYSISTIYPLKPRGPLVPGARLPIGFGSSSEQPLRFHVPEGEEYDVGYLRLFVSTCELPMEAISQPSIYQHRRYGDDPRFEYTRVWDVRTIVLRVERSAPDLS